MEDTFRVVCRRSQVHVGDIQNREIKTFSRKNQRNRQKFPENKWSSYKVAKPTQAEEHTERSEGSR